MSTGEGPLCSVEECDRPVVARGWCRKHYRAWTYYRDPLGTGTRREPPRRGCAVPECDGEHCARGLCANHYVQWRYRVARMSGGPLRQPKPRPPRPVLTVDAGRLLTEAGGSPEVMTVDDVAALLRLQPDHVRALSRDGVLPAYRLSGRTLLRYMRAEIVEWLRSRQETDGSQC